MVDQDREIKELQSKLESVQKDLHDKTRQFYAMHQKTKGLEKTIHTIHEGKVQKKSDIDGKQDFCIPRGAFTFAPNATLRLRLRSIFLNATRIKVWQYYIKEGTTCFFNENFHIF